MDYKDTFPSLTQYLPNHLINQSNMSHNQLIKLFNHLLSQQKLPDEPLSSLQIKFFLNQFALMDSNNLIKKVGVGEREGRVYSDIIKERYFGLAHGIGRSGELLAIQPKAAGSSVLQQLTHRLMLDCLSVLGMGNINGCLLLPFATGMALNLSLLTLRQKKKKSKYVILLRIDQKTCIKCIYTAGLEPIIVKNRYDKPDTDEIMGLETDLDDLEAVLKKHDKEEILCIMSTSSCFAPRDPDDVVVIGQIARKYDVFHVVNNAYGLQCNKTIDMLNKANKDDLVDLIIQSTDKNFMVPVGGSLVISKSKEYITDISKNYPGRASANCVIDIFITLLSLGKTGFKGLIKERKQNFELLRTELVEYAKVVGERVVKNKRNRISLAFTLTGLEHRAKDLGGFLFNKGIMGARVVVPDNKEKTIVESSFKNFGGHIDGYYPGLPYVTIAAAIGGNKDEIIKFMKAFKECYKQLKKKNK